MNILDIIEKKKNGQELTKDEINFWITDYCRGVIPDYQCSALLMAIRLVGMTDEETFDLTEAMLHSGKTIDLSSISGLKCDKHSTGGVGDKTSMVLCPMVASLGVKVAKMSGRGLGFTGGTLDKLESIPGFRVELNEDEFKNTVSRVGMSIIGQSKNLVPADKKLYSLRDVTGTVDSIPLIASSIMSKKLAAGCDCILLDVKYGSGAFMRTKEEAEALAKTMVKIGNYFEKDTKAEITSMAEPLGNAIGNILEVQEAIQTLRGEGPKDFVDLCLSSGTTMLLQAHVYQDRKAARRALEKVLTNGKALKVFTNFVKSQGGDTTYIDDPSKFPKAMYEVPIRSVKSGYVKAINTYDLGLASVELGAGRETKDDVIDPTAGIIIHKKIGDEVVKNDVLLTLYSERPGMDKLAGRLINDFDFDDNPCTPPKVVEEVISIGTNGDDFLIREE